MNGYPLLLGAWGPQETLGGAQAQETGTGTEQRGREPLKKNFGNTGVHLLPYGKPYEKVIHRELR